MGMSEVGERQDAVARLLRWYAAMGVEEACGASPVDWLERGSEGPGVWFGKGFTEAGEAGADAGVAVRPVAGEKVTSLPPGPAVVRAAVSADAAIMSAREQAKAARSLAELRHMLENFDGCGLKAMASNLCFFRGAEQAELMIIGEAPGRDEDIAGQPFVGRAGQLLDKMLEAAGLGEGRVHVTNIVYWRPPGNRTPSLQEVEVCRPFLERQIELVGPRCLLLLGAAAAKAVFETGDGIMKLRGRWRKVMVEGRECQAMATLHPAFLLRSAIYKRLAWKDLLAVQVALERDN